jgi:hypothetical protein
VSGAAAAYQGAYSSGSNWQQTGANINSSTALHQPSHIARSASLAANPQSHLQHSTASAASAAGLDAFSAGSMDFSQDVNLQDWLTAHSSTLTAPATAAVLPSSPSYCPHVVAPLKLPINRSDSSSLARHSSIGTAMLVPIQPANIFEASIAARPNFEARELPPSCYWYQVVNALILCVLLAGTVIELVTGKAL